MLLSFTSIRSGLLPRAAWVFALLSAALPASAQSFEWAAPRAIAYASTPQMLHSAASVAPGGRCRWWASPEAHRLFYQNSMGPLRLIRQRADGTMAHQQLIEGSACVHQVQATPDGGVLLLGEFKDSLVIDAQHRYVNPFVNTGLTYFLTSLDSAGAVRWHRTLRPAAGPGLTLVQAANAVLLDPRGGSAWVGYDTFGDSYAMRVALTTGDSLSTIVQHGVSRITGLAVAPDGTVYTAGGCAEQSGVYNGTPMGLPPGLTYNTYVACYAPTGALRWVRHIEDVTCPAPSVATADTTGVYFAGPLHGAWRFGAWQAALPGGGASANDSYFLTRLDRRTGTFQWLREAPAAGFSGNTQPAAFQSLALDGAGNVWLLTTTTRTTAWPGFGPITSPVGGGAAVLAYDPAGTLRAVQVAGGESSVAHTLAIDPLTAQGIVAGLSPNGGVQFTPLAALPMVAQTETQLFTAGFRAVLAPLGTRPPATAAALNVYPNPAARGEALRLVGATGTIEVLDATGRRVELVPAAALTAPRAAGLYLLRAHDPRGHTRVARLLVTHH